MERTDQMSYIQDEKIHIIIKDASVCICGIYKNKTKNKKKNKGAATIKHTTQTTKQS